MEDFELVELEREPEAPLEAPLEEAFEATIVGVKSEAKPVAEPPPQVCQPVATPVQPQMAKAPPAAWARRLPRINWPAEREAHQDCGLHPCLSSLIRL